MSIHECKRDEVRQEPFCLVCGLNFERAEMGPVYSPREALKKADEMILRLGFTKIRELGE